MRQRTSFFYTLRQLKPHIRKRSRVLKQFSDKLGFAHLGAMHQHDDEYDTIRGFTASVSHRDSNYAVGTYDGINVRIIDRFDVQKRLTTSLIPQGWVILEFELQSTDIPHTFFIPTGKEGAAYDRVFAANIHMQPLNSVLQHVNHSPEFYGRYQILARATHSHKVENLLTSPVIFGIGEKLWPHGLEVNGNRLYVYISEPSPTMHTLDTALLAGLWLTNELMLAQTESL